MSTVCVLTPIVVGSWPAITTAVLGAMGAMGFATAGQETAVARRSGTERCETVVPNSEVISDTLARGEKLRFENDGVTIELGIDDRGRCVVCASGGNLSKTQLERLGQEVAGRVVQQFTYHKLVNELRNRGYEIADEQLTQDQSIQLRVRLGH